MPHDDDRIRTKLASKGWDTLRPTFEEVHNALLSVDDDVAAELTTIYVKYKYAPDSVSSVFAVTWIKTVKQIIIGLAMPPDSIPEGLSAAPPRCHYPPMNGYLTLKEGDEVPRAFPDWVRMAFEYRKTVP